MSLLKTNTLFNYVNGFLIDLAVPANLSYAWGIGSTLALCLVVQIMTGFSLASSYVGHIDMAFDSVEFLISEVFQGWMISALHSLTAGLFLTLTYLHIGSGLYYGSFKSPSQALWLSGVILLMLLMATAFFGYTLPYGSMSLWGAIVITSLMSAIPVVGVDLVHWIWGGFSVSEPTLTSFYALHYLLPFAMAGVIIVHLVLLHEQGSTNPLGLASGHNKISFTPYFWPKDLVGWMSMAVVLLLVVMYEPDLMGHPDNYVEADPNKTPTSIVPEFYFLPFYAILSAVPGKLAGVSLMVTAILMLATLPFTMSGKMSSLKFKPLQATLFWVFCANFIVLGWLGQVSMEYPFSTMTKICTILYFAYFMPSKGS